MTAYTRPSAVTDESLAHRMAESIKESNFSYSVMTAAYRELLTSDHPDTHRLRGETALILADRLRKTDPRLSNAYAQESIDAFTGLKSSGAKDREPLLKDGLADLVRGGVTRIDDLLALARKHAARKRPYKS